MELLQYRVAFKHDYKNINQIPSRKNLDKFYQCFLDIFQLLLASWANLNFCFQFIENSGSDHNLAEDSHRLVFRSCTDLSDPQVWNDLQKWRFKLSTIPYKKDIDINSQIDTNNQTDTNNQIDTMNNIVKINWSRGVFRGKGLSKACVLCV